MDRRRFVKITGVAAAAGATGCIGGGGNGDDGGDGEDGGDNGGDGGDGGGAETSVGQDGNYTDLTGQDEAEVMVGPSQELQYKFNPADIRIDPGTTVRWVWGGYGSQHNVVEADGDQPLDDPSFESELVAEEGHEFTHTFEEAGTYDYVCSVHLAQNMVGSVEVVEGEGGSGMGEGGGGEMGGNETDAGSGGMNESDGGMDGNESMSGNESM
jgi:halocyanin-like protein